MKPWPPLHFPNAFCGWASGRNLPPTSPDAIQDHETAVGGRVAVAEVDIAVVSGPAPALEMKVSDGRGKVAN
jgi:hypothetical protein